MVKPLRAVSLLLFCFLLIFFIPLFVLPFFNHPSADDYVCGIHLRREGLEHYQSFIYQNWGGRFAATFTGSLFAIQSFLYSHYYVHSLLLLASNILSTYFILSRIARYIVKENFSLSHILLYSFLLIALEYSIITEPSTYLFWFSSAITYHTPVILLKCQAGLWLVYHYKQNPIIKRISGFLILLLIAVINGFTEIFIITQFFLIAGMFLIDFFKKQTSFLLLILSFYAISAAFVLLAPGNESRSSLLISKSVLTGLSVVIFQSGEVVWSICKNLLFWLCAISVFIFSNHKKEIVTSQRYLRFPVAKPLYFLVIIVLFLFSATGLAVAGLKGGMVPERYLNAVIAITTFMLLILSFLLGISSPKFHLQIKTNHLQILFYTVMIIGLFANDFIKEEYQNIISAPLYNKIMNEREATLKHAGGKASIPLESYDSALQKMLAATSETSSATISGWLSRKPCLLYYNDDLSNEYSRQTLADFYNIKTIAVK